MYPTDTLTILTPIVFFALLVLFPLIGFFAGWKRAAYWGGGNFLVYIIGLIIWKTVGGGIAKGFINLLVAIVGQDILKYDFNTLLTSIITPLYFVIVILGGNLVLVICYYTFVKRLLKIGKYSKPKYNKNVQVATQSKNGKTHVANTKWFNRTVGAIGLTALMLPITLSTTHLTTIVTTNTRTRQTNSFARGMYDGLQSLSSNMNWFSYYNKDVTGRDFDALFSALSLYTLQITYKDSNGETQTGNPVKAVTESIKVGYDNLINLTLDKNISIQTKESIQPIVDVLNNFVDSFNSIIELCTLDLEVLLDSIGITDLVRSTIEPSFGSIQISNEKVLAAFVAADNVFDALVRGYILGSVKTKDEQETSVHKIIINIGVHQDTFDSMVNTVFSVYDTSALTEASQKVLKESIAKQLQLIFYVK